MYEMFVIAPLSLRQAASLKIAPERLSCQNTEELVMLNASICMLHAVRGRPAGRLSAFVMPLVWRAVELGRPKENRPACTP